MARPQLLGVRQGSASASGVPGRQLAPARSPCSALPWPCLFPKQLSSAFSFGHHPNTLPLPLCQKQVMPALAGQAGDRGLLQVGSNACPTASLPWV